MVLWRLFTRSCKHCLLHVDALRKSMKPDCSQWSQTTERCVKHASKCSVWDISVTLVIVPVRETLLDTLAARWSWILDSYHTLLLTGEGPNCINKLHLCSPGQPSVTGSNMSVLIWYKALRLWFQCQVRFTICRFCVLWLVSSVNDAVIPF